MPDNTFTNLPFLFKICLCVIGAMFALLLSGDIDQDGKIKINLYVIIRFIFSIAIGLTAGKFVMLHFGYEPDYWVDNLFSMLSSVFGMLIVGLVYQSINLYQGKSLHEIFVEVKKAFKALLR